MPEPDHMNLLQKFWVEICTAIGGLVLVFRQKIASLPGWLLSLITGNFLEKLEAHEKRDVERFDEVNQNISNSEDRVIRANDSTKLDIMQAIARLEGSMNQRLNLMEKTFLDDRLRGKHE